MQKNGDHNAGRKQKLTPNENINENKSCTGGRVYCTASAPAAGIEEREKERMRIAHTLPSRKILLISCTVVVAFGW